MTQEELKQRLIELLSTAGWNLFADKRAKQDIADHLVARGVTIQQQAKWIHLGGDEWACSACGNVISTEGSWEKPTQKHCDECGAKMLGVTFKQKRQWTFLTREEVLEEKENKA